MSWPVGIAHWAPKSYMVGAFVHVTVDGDVVRLTVRNAESLDEPSRVTSVTIPIDDALHLFQKAVDGLSTES
jgi:hypothetical protein